MLLALVTLACGGGDDDDAAPPTTVYLPFEDDGRWDLAWQDDFDGSGLSDRWDVEESAFGTGNAEEQCYVPSGVRVSDGLLRLVATEGAARCDGHSRPWTSGMVRSRVVLSHGAVEVRARMPEGPGMLAAAWMLSRNRPYGAEGRSGEIDIIEVNTTSPSEALLTAHWSRTGCGGGCDKQSATWPFPPGSPASEFHLYRLEWTPDRLEWSVDGEVALSIGAGEERSWASAAARPAPGVLRFPAPFDGENRMYLLLNLAVGGNLPGSPTGSTPSPSAMEVDWVKVFT